MQNDAVTAEVKLVVDGFNTLLGATLRGMRKPGFRDQLRHLHQLFRRGILIERPFQTGHQLVGTKAR